MVVRKLNNCTHGRISLLKGYPVCMDCKSEFKNGELAKFRNQRMIKCSHEKLEHGYASNPPQSRCLECGEFFTKRELNAIKPYTEEIKQLREALENIRKVELGRVPKYEAVEMKRIASKALEGDSK